MISDSASGRSNGVRFASAAAAVRNRKKPTRPHGVKRCQLCRKPKWTPDWLCTMAVRESVPVIITTVSDERMRGIS